MLTRSSASILLLSLALGACTAATANEAVEDSEAEALAADLRDGCQSPRRYDGYVKSGACVNIDTSNGTFRARALSGDAPDGICAYTYRAKDGSGRAPTAREVRRLSEVATIAPNCERRAPSSATLEEVPYFIPPWMGGVVGCDVCGTKSVRKREGWVVLPPTIVKDRVIEARLASGQTRAFALHNVATGASTARFELPPAPEGDAWVPGTILVR